MARKKSKRRRRRQRGGLVRYSPRRLKHGGNLFRSEPFIGHWRDEPLDAALFRQRNLHRMLRQAARR